MKTKRVSRSLPAFALGLAIATLAQAAYATPVNYALSGVATASSSYFPAAQVNDGADTTGWTALGHGTAANPQWVVVDLGSVLNINQIIADRKGGFKPQVQKAQHDAA